MFLKSDIVFLNIAILAILLALSNYEYYELIIAGSTEIIDLYPITSQLIGGDSYLYYHSSFFEYVPIIYEGLLSGGVSVGSILSLIGISLINDLVKFIFGNYLYIGWVLFNILVLLLSYLNIRKIIKSWNYSFFPSLIISPILFYLITQPNKEIIALFLLSTLYKIIKSGYSIYDSFNLPFAAIFRDTYLVIILIYPFLKKINFFYIFLLLPVLIGLSLPDGYFQNVGIEKMQASYKYTTLAKELMQTVILSPLAVVIKFFMASFAQLRPSILLEIIPDLKITRLIFSYTALILWIVPSFYFFRLREQITIPEMLFLKVLLVGVILFSFTQGNPARYLLPFAVFYFLVVCEIRFLRLKI